MEVHQHSHTIVPEPSTSSGHRGLRKKWSHYLWEFLMLFLAVFCGFLAEYQLEHKIEKERAKQYILSFYEDLKTDTAKIYFVLKFDNEKIAALRNMVDCYDSVTGKLGAGCLVELIRHSKSNRNFKVTDRTLRQLTNAGGFRLLHREDADSILSYEALFNSYEDFQATIFQTAQDNVRNTTNGIFSFKNINTLLQESISLITNIDSTQFDLEGQLIFSDDKYLLNKWFNELAVYLRVTKAQRNLLLAFKEKASRLLIYFNQKYKVQ